MTSMNTDHEWEKWGAQEPYFGVITNPEFRRSNLGASAKEKFFASGRVHVDHIMRVCRERIATDFRPRRALDFGCGVGRVTFALAAICEEVTGLDVSASMLQEAELNRVEQTIHNVSFVISDDDLSRVDGTYDFIHSFIVFQHLEVPRGRYLFAKLIARVAPGGILATHFTYAKAVHAQSFGRPPLTADAVGAELPLDGKQRDPIMLMNPYDLNELLFVMQTARISNFFTEFTDHGGELGVLLYFQTPTS